MPAPVATRLRTASTDLVRKATLGRALNAASSLPVFSSVSSTVSMISGSGTMSEIEMISASASRCPSGSHSRYGDVSKISACNATRSRRFEITITATSSSPPTSRCSR